MKGGGQGVSGDVWRGLTGFVGSDFRIRSNDMDRSGYCSARRRSMSVPIVSHQEKRSRVYEHQMETYLQMRNPLARRSSE